MMDKTIETRALREASPWWGNNLRSVRIKKTDETCSLGKV